MTDGAPRWQHGVRAVLVAGLLSTQGGNMHAAEFETEAHNKQVVRMAFDAWRDGRGSVFDLLEPDARWTIVGNAPVSKTYPSRQAFSTT